MKLILENWNKFLNEQETAKKWRFILNDVISKMLDKAEEAGDNEAVQKLLDFEGKAPGIEARASVEERNSDLFWYNRFLELSRLGDLDSIAPTEVKKLMTAPPSKDSGTESSEGDFKILSPVFTYDESSPRDVVVVQTKYGAVPFYRSSGTGSGSATKGNWYPFFGIVNYVIKGHDDIMHDIAKLSKGPECCGISPVTGKKKTSKFPKEGGEFDKAGKWLKKQNLSSSMSVSGWIKRNAKLWEEIPERIIKHFFERKMPYGSGEYDYSRPLPNMYAAALNYLLIKYGVDFDKLSPHSIFGLNTIIGLRTIARVIDDTASPSQRRYKRSRAPIPQIIPFMKGA